MSNESQRDYPRIYLRHDQRISDIESEKHNDSKVTIFAPQWLEIALDQFKNLIPRGTKFTIMDRTDQSTIKTLENELSLKDLIMFARNEPSNVTGRIKFELFEPFIKDETVIYSLKDLARQCVIIGTDNTQYYGGYCSKGPIRQKEEVILIDSIGLQFQQKYNTGRLVLISDTIEKGLLDDLIFDKVVGEVKKSKEEAKNDRTERFVQINNTYFDTFAYEMFVANDFLLVSLALNQMDVQHMNLKFLKYGTGFFAASFRTVIEKHISRGIYRGMKALFQTKRNMKIKSFEFPFYAKDQNIIDLCKQYGTECRFSFDDALKRTHPELITATTNCSDPHSVTGNEMGYSSVDAAIAQNLESRGNKFSPLLNHEMKEEFLELPNFSHN